MSITGDEGELEMYARVGTDELRLFDFVFEVAEEGEEYELRMECDKGCEGQDLSFELDCVLDEFDLLDCEANKHFTGYGFFEFEQTAD